MTTQTYSTFPKTTTSGVSVPEVRNILGGKVIAPNDTLYDEARTVYYGGIDRRPAFIVKAKSAADVSRVIMLARESGLELAVRSGGHSLVGHSTTDGGIVLDLSEMKKLEIDVDGRTAWAQTGLTAGEYTTAVAVHGLATGFGDTGSVGIGGITLGGGIGYLVRKHGLSIDSLVAAEIVTADARLLCVDADTHPDLFWAIRGGGGNFGVATRFKFRLHEVDNILGGMLVLPATPDTIAAFIAEADAAPAELSSIVNVLVAPPLPFLPADAHGQPIIMATMVYAGNVEAGERAVAPFRAIADPFADMLRPMHYPDIFPAEQAGHPIQSTRTMFLDALDRSLAQTMLEHLRASTADLAAAEIRVLGGAMARVSPEATAFAHRRAPIMVNLAARCARVDEATAHEAWVSQFAAALRPGGGGGGAYVGFLGGDGHARIREAYPGATWERLAAIKQRYDPTNMFHLNHNITPG
jgi:FAD/FMN-containing dehydrogenase